MPHDSFLQLSKKVIINLDKVLYIEWVERDGNTLYARVTYDIGTRVYYSGEEAQILWQALSHNFDGAEPYGTHPA